MYNFFTSILASFSTNQASLLVYLSGGLLAGKFKQSTRELTDFVRCDAAGGNLLGTTLLVVSESAGVV